MTTRNFDALFTPRTIVLVGASRREASVGAVLARNLAAGGFAGELVFVNPHADSIAGHACIPDLSALACTPDLAVIATPAAGVSALVRDLGARGCRAAVVISAGDKHFRQELLDAAHPHNMRIMGPNCLGLLSPVAGINASFAQLTPARGHLALVTQSGAIATSVLDWAHGRGVGFSHILSLGDMIDVDFGDALDFLALDSATSAILLYVEQITQARKFMSAARMASRAKPVLVVKAGRSAGGAKAAQSHTGALAGADNVYDAAFRRAGMLRVETLGELFDAAEMLSTGMRPLGRRLTIVTNGGGLGVLATDALETGKGQLAPLSDAGRQALDAALPASWSRGNPIDILGDAGQARYTAALAVAVKEPESDAVLVMNCPTGVADNVACAKAVAAASAQGKPLLACWMGAASLDAPRRIFSEAGIPLLESPEDAVGAFLQLAEFAENQHALLETPAPDHKRAASAIETVDAIIAAALGENRTLLNAAEAKSILAAYGIAVAAARTVADPAAAAREAQSVSGPVALKILSRDITHKSDVGGIALNLQPDEVEAAARAMLDRVAAKAPNARLDGFTIEAMIAKPHAQELIVGASVDPTFGTVILFGQGGVAVEAIADTVIALPPLNSSLARRLIGRTRVSRLLAGYRDHPPADQDAIVAALLAVSDLLVAHPQIVELDINPLLSDAAGAIALDARIVVAPPGAKPGPRLVIAPYPAECESRIELSGGQHYDVRPLRPADTGALVKLGSAATDPDVRLRFYGAVRADVHLGAARLAQLDYDREMALGAFDASGAMAGVARVQFDPQIETGAFALLVSRHEQGRGLGRALMRQLLDYARSRGAKALEADIPASNTTMIDLVRALGARLEPSAGATRAVFALA